MISKETARPRGTDRAWVEQVVVTESILGRGTEEDPVRILKQFWSFGGVLLAQHDTLYSVGKEAST